MANEKIVNRENLKAFRQANDERYKSGQVVVAKSLTTKAIDNISDESGTTQETPFILQGTGTANNTDIVDTSPIGKHVEKQGNTVAVNQLIPANNSESAGSITYTYSNGALTIPSQTLSGNAYIYLGGYQQLNVVNGHKYLLFLTNSAITGISLNAYTNNVGNLGNTTTTAILTANFSGNVNIYVKVEEGTYASNNIFKPQVIDLTQWFNGDIPQDLLDHPEHWSWYQNYGDYIAYNTGSLENADGQYLQCGGRNAWDEQWEIGALSGQTGEETELLARMRSKNFCRCIPNRTYYGLIPSGTILYVLWYDINKNYIGYVDMSRTTKTSPANACYFKISPNEAYGNAYHNDITISIYYATGDSYDQYFPYEQPKVYDTGTEVLRKAGSVKDYKEPNGTITRRIAIITINGTETFNRNDSWGANSFAVQNKAPGCDSAFIKNTTSNNLGFNNESASNVVNAGVRPNEYKVGVGNSSWLYVNVPNCTTNAEVQAYFSAHPMTLYYELATPTTEQGTPFSENIEINDYGTMGWLDTNNAYVDIPQGCKIFYPADYVLFLDSLNTITQGDASKLVLDSELSASETQRDTVDTQLQNAIGGTLRHCLAIQESELNFEDTDYIDLGTLTWETATSSGGYTYFKSNAITGIKSDGKSLCSKYKTVLPSAVGGTNESIAVASVQIFVRDDTYNNATTFKNAMKGVLLAYEKA